MTDQQNVRISAEAHKLLAEKAERFDVSMKDITSEAIFSLFREKTRNIAKVAIVSIVSFGVGFLCGHFIGVL